MKKISNYFQVLLAIAVAILFYLHFSEKKTEENKFASLPSAGSIPSSGMVFVNIDSLLERYILYQKLKTDFEKKQTIFENEMEKRKNSLETEYTAAQNKARAGQLTEMQMAETEEKLMRKQQELMYYKQEEEEKLGEQNQKMTKDIFSKIHDFLYKINKEANYQFVFGYTREGGILLANDSLNITKYVVEGLNQEAQEN